MHKNVILAGIGGQGILTLAGIIDHAAMQSGLLIKKTLRTFGVLKWGKDLFPLILKLKKQ